MNLNRLWWLLIIPGAFLFEQNRFKVIFERLEVADFNKSYFEFVRTHNFKHNRTNAATILTDHEKVEFGFELKLEVQAYKSASNEYREFPLRFMFDYCEYADKNEFGLGELFACGNSTGCPFRKGLYTSCKWAPNGKKFPPNLPGGSYMFELKFFYHSVDVLFLQLYVTVKYPELVSKL